MHRSIAIEAREMNVNKDQTVSERAKQAWVRPELKQLVAGAAESQAGGTPDGGGGAQGS